MGLDISHSASHRGIDRENFLFPVWDVTESQAYPPHRASSPSAYSGAPIETWQEPHGTTDYVLEDQEDEDSSLADSFLNLNDPYFTEAKLSSSMGDLMTSHPINTYHGIHDLHQSAVWIHPQMLWTSSQPSSETDIIEQPQDNEILGLNEPLLCMIWPNFWLNRLPKDTQEYIAIRLRPFLGLQDTIVGHAQARMMAQQYLGDNDGLKILDETTIDSELQHIADAMWSAYFNDGKKIRMYIKGAFTKYCHVTTATAKYYTREAFKDESLMHGTTLDIFKYISDIFSLKPPRSASKAAYREKRLAEIGEDAFYSRSLLALDFYLKEVLTVQYGMCASTAARHTRDTLAIEDILNFSPSVILKTILDAWADMQPDSDIKRRYRDENGIPQRPQRRNGT